ncbi:subtilisin-like protein, partial [Ramicandelaber brevisporus]
SGVKSVWKAALNGYAAKLSDEALAALRNLPEVEYVEHNKRVGVAEGIWNAPWNLVRISSRKKYSGPDYYSYGGWAGYETKVFVVDTGIRTTHGDFDGRASWGANFIDTNNYDGHGHGTHCAALVCSRNYGVAKMAQLVAVKVLGNDGWGTDESVISGIDWVT